MPNYSYKVRVLAALDNHGAGAVHILTIEAKVRSDCQQNNINLPTTWRRWVKTSIEKLVEDEWLQDKGHQTYTSTPALRDLIAEEKARLGVPAENHELKTFVGVTKKLTSKPTTPKPARTRKRRSLAVAVEVESTDGEPSAEVEANPDAIILRPTKKARVRYSQPGSSQRSTAQRKRHSLPVATTSSPQPSSSQSKGRRRSSGGAKTVASRTNRRHTLPAVIHNNTQEPPSFPSAVSRELQFIPLREVLSSRARRSIRRAGLSDEINNIDAEKRVASRRNREEMMRLRKEMEEKEKKLEELERLLQAARMAPPSETGSIGAPSVGMAPIHEDEEPDDVSSPAPFVFGSAPRTPFRFTPSAISPAIRRLQDHVPGETPISRRDKKIKHLESEIEALRQDISQREEEERRRAEEEELFHDAEEQILREDMSNLTPDFASTPKRSVSSGNEVRSAEKEVEEVPEPGQVSFGGSVDEAEEDEQEDAGIPYSETLESIADSSMQMGESISSDNIEPIEIEVEETLTISTNVITSVQQENEILKTSIEILKRRVEALEEDLAEAPPQPETHTGGTQTDPYVDAEVKKLRELVEELEDNNQLLEQSSLEERQRIWEKIGGHITSLEHEPDGMEDLDMAISEILTNLALAESLAGERANAQEKAERDLIVERRAREEKEAELLKKNAEIERLATKVEELTDLKSKLEEQSENLEYEKEKIEDKLADLEAELRTEQDRVNKLEDELLATTVKADESVNDLAEIMELFDEELSSTESDSEENTIVAKVSMFVESLREQKEELEGTIEDLEASLETEREAVKELRETLTTLRTKYQDAEISARELEASLINKEKDMESIEEQLGELKGKYDEIQKTNEMLNGVIATKNDKISSLTKQINLLNEELDLLSQKNEATLQTVDELEAKLDRLSEIISEKNDEIEDLRRVHAEQLAAKDKDIDSLTQQMSKLKAENEIGSERIVELEHLVVDKDEAISRLEKTHAEQIETKSHLITSMDEQILSLHGRVAQLTGEQTLAQKKIDELHNLLCVKEDAICNLRRTYDEDVAEKDARINELQQQVSMQHGEVSELMNNLASISKEKEDIEQKAGTLLEQIEKKEQQIAELEKLHEVIARKGDTMKEMSNELQSLREELSVLNARYSALEVHVSKLVYTEDLLRKEVEGLKVEIQTKEDTIQELEKLKEVIATNAETINSLNGQLATITSELEELSVKHENAESKIEELSEQVMRKEKTVAQLEFDLDQASIREAEANKRFTDAIADQEHLREEVEQLKGTFEDREAEIEQLKGSLDEKEAQIEEFKSAIDDRDNLIEYRDEEIEKLKEQIAEFEKSIREIIVSHQEAIENLRADLTKEKNDAVYAMELKLQKAVQSRADIETELFQVCADYKTKIVALEDKVNGLERDVARAEGEAEDLRIALTDMEEEKDQVIEKLEKKIQEITQENERVVKEFTAELESRREKIATLEKTLSDLQDTSEKEKQNLKGQIESQATELAKLRQDIAKSEESLLASYEAEDALEHEIQEKETEVQLLKEKMEDTRTLLLEENETLSKELDAIRLELSQAKDQIRKEIQQHVALMRERDAMVAELNEQIEALNAENKALSIKVRKWEQKYSQAVDDGAAKIDDIRNNLMTVLSRADEKKAEFVDRAKTRLDTELLVFEDRQHITFADEDMTGEDKSEEGTTSSSGLLSIGATTNVSTIFSPPTPTTSSGATGLGLTAMFHTQSKTLKRKHGNRGKRRDDSGIGLGIGEEEEEEDIVEEEERRFVEYGRQRAGFEVAS